MSDKRKDPQASLATLQKEVETLLDKAEETRQQLGATRRQILDAQLQASHEMLEHIEAINQFRQEIREMLVQLEGFDPDDLEAIRSMGEQLATAPLFHPQFEELLARKANAANNGRSFDEQLREQVLDRLDEFSFFPGEKENTAHNAAVKNLIHADKLAKTWELPTLSRLLLSQDPAARLDAEAALSLFSKLKEGLQ